MINESGEWIYNGCYDTGRMGNDGTMTMFIDIVNKQFSTSSTTPEDKRHEMLDDIKPMFDIIRSENK